MPFTINYNTQCTINNFYNIEAHTKDFKKPHKTAKFKSITPPKSILSYALPFKKLISPRVFHDIENSQLNCSVTKASEIVGYMLLAIILMFFCWFSLNFFGMFISSNKPENHIFLDELYYCLLIPLSLPVSVLAIYCNWIAVKFFRHN